MSLGPSMENAADPTPPLPSRTIYATKKSVIAFFTRPLHYLFYATLSCVIVGLIFGAQFSSMLYVILSCLALVEAIQSAVSKIMETNIPEKK